MVLQGNIFTAGVCQIPMPKDTPGRIDELDSAKDFYWQIEWDNFHHHAVSWGLLLLRNSTVGGGGIQGCSEREALLVEILASVERFSGTQASGMDYQKKGNVTAVSNQQLCVFAVWYKCEGNVKTESHVGLDSSHSIDCPFLAKKQLSFYLVKSFPCCTK